jgi:NitT/TauT family transport system substrate-binding protein
VLTTLFACIASRRVAIAASLALAVSATASAAGTVKLGTNVWIGYAPFYVADQLNLYKKSNTKVKLQFFTDLSLVPPAMASGGVDGGLLTYDMVLGTAARGMGHRVVMPIDYSNGGDAIVATKAITKLSQFKGQKVGFNPLSPSDFLLSYALKKGGMSEKDIKPVNMGAEAVASAMASGGVPIGVTYEPNVSQITTIDNGSKFHVVYSSKDAPGLITDVLVFDKKYIDAHPNEIKAVIQGYLDALDYMKKEPDKAAALIGKAMKISAKEVKEQLPTIYNLPLAEMPKVFAKSSDSLSLFGSGQVIAEILKAKGQIKSIPAIESTFDDQFVKALLVAK